MMTDWVTHVIEIHGDDAPEKASITLEKCEAKFSIFKKPETFSDRLMIIIEQTWELEEGAQSEEEKKWFKDYSLQASSKNTRVKFHYVPKIPVMGIDGSLSFTDKRIEPTRIKVVTLTFSLEVDTDSDRDRRLLLRLPSLPSPPSSIMYKWDRYDPGEIAKIIGEHVSKKGSKGSGKHFEGPYDSFKKRSPAKLSYSPSFSAPSRRKMPVEEFVSEIDALKLETGESGWGESKERDILSERAFSGLEEAKIRHISSLRSDSDIKTVLDELRRAHSDATVSDSRGAEDTRHDHASDPFSSLKRRQILAALAEIKVSLRNYPEATSDAIKEVMQKDPAFADSLKGIVLDISPSSVTESNPVIVEGFTDEEEELRSEMSSLIEEGREKVRRW